MAYIRSRGSVVGTSSYAVVRLAACRDRQISVDAYCRLDGAVYMKDSHYQKIEN